MKLLVYLVTELKLFNQRVCTESDKTLHKCYKFFFSFFSYEVKMNYILKNKKERLVNLGCINGTMLVLNPKESITISESEYNDFANVLNSYVEGDFIVIEQIGVKKKISTPELESTLPKRGRPKTNVLQEMVESNE